MEISEIIHQDQPANDERPFECRFEACRKSFGRRSDLVRHERIHTNDRPYKCFQPGCNRSFIQRSALTVHLRTHTGEKPHVCEYPHCHKTFSDSSSLARHRRTHTGKKPYRCPAESCGKSFVRKTMLIKHMKQNHCLTKNGRPQIQWQPFLEERRLSAELQAAGDVCWSISQPSTPPLSTRSTSPCSQEPSSPRQGFWYLSPSLPSTISSPDKIVRPVATRACTLPSFNSILDHHDPLPLFQKSFALYSS